MGTCCSKEQYSNDNNDDNNVSRDSVRIDEGGTIIKNALRIDDDESGTVELKKAEVKAEVINATEATNSTNSTNSTTTTTTTNTTTESNTNTDNKKKSVKNYNVKIWINRIMGNNGEVQCLFTGDLNQDGSLCNGTLEIPKAQFQNDFLGQIVEVEEPSMVYIGDFLNNKYYGKGKLYRENQIIYDGEWQDGNRNVQGIEYFFKDFEKEEWLHEFWKNNWNDYIKYDGEWKDNEYHGKGKCYTFLQIFDTHYYLDFEGVFKEGTKNGPAKYWEFFGGSFECTYKEGYRHGKGTKYSGDGSLEYTDLWIDGERIFKNQHFFKSGNIKYDGNWNNSISGQGTYHGQGKLYYENGKIEYDGSFNNGSYHGQGKLYHENGNIKFDGNFNSGSYNGQGKLYHENGNIEYDGGWMNGNRHGQGTSCYGSSVYYEGGWKDDKYDGKGKKYYNDHVNYVGHYENGEKHGYGEEYVSDMYVGGELKTYCSYKGYFENGLKSGNGETYSIIGGSYSSLGVKKVYEGGFLRGEYHGYGKHYSQRDYSIDYEGEWDMGHPITPSPEFTSEYGSHVRNK